MRLPYLAAILCSLLFYSSISDARLGVSVAFGNGTKKVKAKRFNIQTAWNSSTKNFRNASGYLELGYTNVISKQTFAFPTNNKLQIISGSINLRVKAVYSIAYFLDLGLGAAYLSSKQIATRQLGTKFLFEDRVGAGILIGKKQSIEISYRFVHYSNAYLAQKNNGLNLHLLNIGYWF